MWLVGDSGSLCRTGTVSCQYQGTAGEAQSCRIFGKYLELGSSVLSVLLDTLPAPGRSGRAVTHSERAPSPGLGADSIPEAL